MAPSQTVRQPEALPAPPGAPQLPVATPAPVATVPVPTIGFLRARGDELSDQLRSASSRRASLVQQMRKASPEARAGLQPRINVLDERLVQLEKDIAENGRMKAAAGGDADITSLTSGTGAVSSLPFGLSPGNVTAISIVFTLFVLFPMALSLSRLLWKRGTRAATAPREPDPRLERVEQAVDAIAIEIERISEGQRFVTQLMTHTEQPDIRLGAHAPAEPVRAQVGNTVMAGAVRRDVVR